MSHSTELLGQTPQLYWGAIAHLWLAVTVVPVGAMGSRDARRIESCVLEFEACPLHVWVCSGVLFASL